MFFLSNFVGMETNSCLRVLFDVLLFTEKSKTDEWKLTLKERKSSKKDERVAPTGPSTEQSQDEIKSHRGAYTVQNNLPNLTNWLCWQ